MKILQISIGIFLSIALFQFCTKGSESITNPNSVENLGEERPPSCSCSYSSFWSSCSITCPVVNGVCLAHCGGSSSGFWPFSITVATCGCASAGTGAVASDESEIYISADNLLNLESSKAILQNYSGSDINTAIDNINILISFYGTKNHSEEITPLILKTIKIIDGLEEEIRQDLANLLE